LLRIAETVSFERM